MPDFPARRGRALACVSEELAVAGLLVTDGPGVAWLTGFSGSNGSVLLTQRGAWLATDGRYRDQARSQSPDVELIIDRATGTALLAKARELGIARVAVEADHVSLATAATWTARADELAEAVASPPVIEGLRAVKDADEIALLCRACEVSTEALQAVTAQVRVGMSELAIARELERLMGECGGDDRAFPTIVAAGANSAIPHHEPTDRPVARGELLKIDFGARVSGYHADCTRTYVVGADPLPWQQELHDLVARAAAAGRAALVPGAAVADVDAAARAVIVEAGQGEHFSHGLGHGVGLQIHESPLLAPGSAGTLTAGVVATVEPGIYLTGRGGVRIEDTCLVTDEGPVLLTTAARELIRLD